jgi:alpha-tubulin suppressor-like RCC1 family protein
LLACSQSIDVLGPSAPLRSPPLADGGLVPDPDDESWWTDAATPDSPCGCGANELCLVDTCLDASGVMSLDAWLSHTCVVERGQLYCWGSGEQGQLGLGDTSSRNARSRVGGNNDWVLAATAERSTCALRAPGLLYCFGSNNSGELGVGDLLERLVPTPVRHDLSFRSLSCGGRNCCALDDERQLYCWGDNLEGKVGQGDPFSAPDALEPLTVLPGVAWSTVELGQGHACAIREDGALFGWGRNPMGEAGLGPGLGQVREPTRIGTETDWVSLAASQHHACGVRAEGSLWCWGQNPFFELGHADPMHVAFVPERMGAESDWASVGAGWFHTCALKRDGRLFCFGRAIEGQLGQGGSIDPILEPTLVESPSRWQSLALGNFQTSGIDDAGALHCWGMGEDGQLGMGDNERRHVPTLVP